MERRHELRRRLRRAHTHVVGGLARPLQRQQPTTPRVQSRIEGARHDHGTLRLASTEALGCGLDARIGVVLQEACDCQQLSSAQLAHVAVVRRPGAQPSEDVGGTRRVAPRGPSARHGERCAASVGVYATVTPRRTPWLLQALRGWPPRGVICEDRVPGCGDHVRVAAVVARETTSATQEEDPMSASAHRGERRVRRQIGQQIGQPPHPQHLQTCRPVGCVWLDTESARCHV